MYLLLLGDLGFELVLKAVVGLVAEVILVCLKQVSEKVILITFTTFMYSD